MLLYPLETQNQHSLLLFPPSARPICHFLARHNYGKVIIPSVDIQHGTESRGCRELLLPCHNEESRNFTVALNTTSSTKIPPTLPLACCVRRPNSRRVAEAQGGNGRHSLWPPPALRSIRREIKFNLSFLAGLWEGKFSGRRKKKYEEGRIWGATALHFNLNLDSEWGLKWPSDRTFTKMPSVISNSTFSM